MELVPSFCTSKMDAVAVVTGSLFVMEANTTIITTNNVMSFMTDLMVGFDEMKY